jgi:hypothetical protein
VGLAYVPSTSQPECLEAIEAMLGEDFEAYLRGAIVKYIWRGLQGASYEDYLKAQVYLTKLLQITAPAEQMADPFSREPRQAVRLG